MNKEQIEQMLTIAFSFKYLGLDIKAISEIISKEMAKKEAKRTEEAISYSYSMKVSGKPEQHTLVRGIAKPGQSYTNRVYMIDGRSVDFTISF